MTAMATLHLFLVHVWLGFLGLFLVLYVVLDGFDLGIGVLSLFVREEERRNIMVASLGSVWDANESWLVVLGGALFGAFPLAYGIVLNALYLPLVTMLLALIFRAVAFEFRAHAHLKTGWNLAFGLGSLVAAICQGFALGGLISGIRVADGRFAGGVFDWLTPFSAVVALGVVFGYVLLGACYLIIKTEGPQQAHSRRQAWIAFGLMLLAAAAVSVWTPLRVPAIQARWFAAPNIYFFAVPPLLALICAGMLARALYRRFEHAPLFWAIGIFLASVVGLAASFYPDIVPRAVTAATAAADSLTLAVMLLGIGILVPTMLVYNAYQYLVFRGKARIGYGEG
jgi:cytochrome bd ubiquinol oxidase subunit II